MLPRDTAEASVYQTHETDHPRDLWILVAKSLSDAARETIEHRDSWFFATEITTIVWPSSQR